MSPVTVPGTPNTWSEVHFRLRGAAARFSFCRAQLAGKMTKATQACVRRRGPSHGTEDTNAKRNGPYFSSKSISLGLPPGRKASCGMTLRADRHDPVRERLHELFQELAGAIVDELALLIEQFVGVADIRLGLLHGWYV
jgi:hypothetical protein